MLRHAFQFVKSVILLIGPQNLRSQKAVEKIAAVLVGSRLDRDTLVFQIIANEAFGRR